MEKKLMGQLLHANARTTQAIRREIRNCEESLVKAAKRFNVNPKTIAKWKKREHPQDLPMGPKKDKVYSTIRGSRTSNSGV